MKKITLVMFIVTSFSAFSFSQNLITNPGFESDVTTFTVVESTANVLMRVAALQDVTTQTANPTVAATAIPAGMWVKKAANSGYVKGVITTTAFNSGLSCLNLKITSGTTQTGLNSWYNCVSLQKVATSLSNTKKYKASVWARIDDITPNASVNIYLFLTDNTAKVNITKTIALTGGTSWTKYETIFDIPTHLLTNPTANFATAFFGAGMTTTYDGASKTNYSGLLIDDFTLEEDVSTSVNETKNLELSFLHTNNGLVASNSGQMTVYSLTGAKLKQQTIQKGDKISMPAGIYVFQLENASGISTQKVNF